MSYQLICKHGRDYKVWDSVAFFLYDHNKEYRETFDGISNDEVNVLITLTMTQLCGA